MLSSQKTDKERLQTKLKILAEEISADLSALEAEQSKELLGNFVSDLYFAAAEQSRRKDHRQRQAEGIAAAKARGVHFGRATKPLPENFDEFHQAWRDGQMSLTEAADGCGMMRDSFRRAAIRKEQAESCAG